MPNPIIMNIGGDIISGVAESIISGGSLLLAGSYTSTVTAKARAQYDYSKIKVGTLGSGLNCVGMALYDAASGTTSEVAILTRGIVITNAQGNCLVGRQAEANEASAGEGSVTVGANAGRGIGRILTEAASGGFTILRLNI